MAIEGFDAALPIENRGFLAEVELSAAAQTRDGPTLDAALEQANRAGPGQAPGRAILRDPDALLLDLWIDNDGWREATLDHLWFRDSVGTTVREDPIERQDTDGMQDTPLRKLNPGELALIAGGSGSDMNGEGGDPGVTVFGPYWDWIFPINDPGDQYPSGGGGGGESNTDIEYTDDNAPCEDGAALKAGTKITELVNTYGKYEFVGVVVRNSDGSFGMANDELSTKWEVGHSTFDDLGDYTHAYGMVHNHPFNSSDYYSNFIQRYPSSADWQSLDRMIAGGANPAHLSVYVLDPFGTMREFKYSDRARYESMTDSQRMQMGGPNLPPATTGCGS